MAEKKHMFLASAVALLISIALYLPTLLFMFGMLAGVYVWKEFDRARDDVRALLVVFPVALALVGIALPAGAALAAGFALSVVVMYLSERG